MTQLGEKIQIHLDNPDSEDCPFCPGKETEHKWKTFKGEDNSGSKLRKAMNDPSLYSYAQQNGARPKDGVYPHQSKDEPAEPQMPKGSTSIYNHTSHGDYKNEAHHCISGKEIMQGEPIEKEITKNGGQYKGDTGYSINNAANGVFLPSYPNKFKGKWSTKSYDDKYKIMKHAMDAGKGQIHIGGHSNHVIEEADKDYPTHIKKDLLKIKKRIVEKSEECPFCVEGDGTPKKPFVPPYKANQWLDNLSKQIKKEIAGPVSKWKFYISKYAKDYYVNEVKNKKKKVSKKNKFSN
ncbi:MAG: AHH domain-containing protein [Kangiellaceae bacterium]|nr:AHH domain-containing protein [Kangiellaceae bacterium]MCW8998923.1 AHH domain-containing protein [Kangiellaceae bacterium]